MVQSTPARETLHDCRHGGGPPGDSGHFPLFPFARSSPVPKQGPFLECGGPDCIDSVAVVPATAVCDWSHGHVWRSGLDQIESDPVPDLSRIPDADHSGFLVAGALAWDPWHNDSAGVGPGACFCTACLSRIQAYRKPGEP